LLIEIRRVLETLVISVSDDGIGIDEHAVMTKGHGIENTRERMRALYGERASLVVARRAEGGTIATLCLPVREFVAEASHEET
jgi:sensor histidine kinase YesM